MDAPHRFEQEIVISTVAVENDIYAPLGELLLDSGKLKSPELARARRLAAQVEHVPLPRFLVKMGLVSERDMAEALAKLSGQPIVESAAYPAASPLPETISPRFLKEFLLAGLEQQPDGYVVAAADPLDSYAIDALALALEKPVQVRVGLPSELERAIEQHSGGAQPPSESADGAIDAALDETDVEHLKDLASEAPVVRLVNTIFQEAVERRASDIHIEPFEHALTVRMRVDGVLRNVDAPPVRSTAAVISRIKIMAKLNIAERRLPQDGRIKLQVQGKELDLRVSTVPTMYGESVVIRLLNKESIVFDFAALGFDGEALQRFLKVLALPHGIILITGPTGSGKSTTLYTALHRINTPERKIITVEDPVEYQLEGINQIQAKPQIGLTFANALRSIVRQDPDVIMIGEMRDLETARIAVQSALTGHLVLSTLHTNDAAGAVTRLLDMGLEDYLITSTVSGILGQRLVRHLCMHCRQPHPALPEAVEQLSLRRFVPSGDVLLYRPVGCEICGGSGYRGRLAITEFLVMTDAIRSLVMAHAQARHIEEAALVEGMHTMMDDGLRKAVEGLTTIEEVMRVTSDT
ncbi:MAG: type II secretion system protein GspE [Methylococcaceae bacterium]|nr:MAG: type II secretion system protein GspE [Methylococcaceae bacterium]